MEIILENVGRRFSADWIFQGINYKFVSGNRYAILGPNGSGKSTLLQIIASSLLPSSGQVSFSLRSKPLDAEQVYAHIVLAAPYMELIEEFSLQEMIRFHFSFKKYLPDFDEEKLIELTGLQHARQRPIKAFSSGMKQKLKLALACCTESEVLLLDEPTTNLDDKTVEWYHRLLKITTGDRLIILSSNQKDEYEAYENLIHLTAFKPGLGNPTY